MGFFFKKRELSLPHQPLCWWWLKDVEDALYTGAKSEVP